MRKLLTLSFTILLLTTLSFNSAFASLELDNFQATKDGSYIVVSWNTLQEMNLNSFIVERSLDGDTWAFAGRVEQLPGNGAYYTFKDINIPDVNGTIYYRVHAYYTDDSFDTSDVIYIKGFEPVPDISINPNPVFSDVILNFSNDMGNEGLVEIFNSSGMLMMQETIPTGLTEYSFDVHALAPGFYVLKVQSGSDIKTQKFIKR